MINYTIELKNILPYLYFFPIYILIIFLIFSIKKKSIDNKGIGFYGMFIGLNDSNILSISLLFLYFYLVVVSIFIPDFSLMTFIILLIPITLLNIINLYFVTFLVDIINTIIICLLLYIKMIFYHYMLDVGVYWYVVVLYILLCLFLLLYSILILIRRFKSIMAKNKYVKNKK